MIAGIDYSSLAVDIVLLDDDTDQATWTRYALHNGDRSLAARVRDVRLRLPTRSWWEDQGVWLVGIEDPMSRFPHVAKVLATIGASVISTLPPKVCVLSTPPKEWKREFCGNANATKADVVAACHRRGFAVNSSATRELVQDAYDAYAIGWAVRLMNARAIARSVRPSVPAEGGVNPAQTA